MSRVGSRDTAPEVAVGGLLKAAGVRFSTNGAGLPGNPDLVVRGLKLAVFVNGCFWHWHGCKRSRMPKTNRRYWEKKIHGNVRRDRRNQRLLNSTGWHYCTVWECNLEQGVRRVLRRIEALRAVRR